MKKIIEAYVFRKQSMKLKKAGADRVVKPSELVSRLKFQLLLPPGVAEFIDVIGKGKQFDLNKEEVRVEGSSSFAGNRSIESPFRKDLNIIIVAIYRNDSSFQDHPVSTDKILPCDLLIAIGQLKSLEKLGTLCSQAEK